MGTMSKKSFAKSPFLQCAFNLSLIIAGIQFSSFRMLTCTNDLLKFKLIIRMRKTGDLSDLECGLVVGWSEYFRNSRGFTEKGLKNSEQQFCG